MFLILGKVFAVFIMGSIGIHLLVMLIDYYLMIRPFHLNLRENFVGTIFSAPMYPMMAAYGLSSLAIYLLWGRAKKAKLYARENVGDIEKILHGKLGELTECRKN